MKKFAATVVTFLITLSYILFPAVAFADSPNCPPNTQPDPAQPGQCVPVGGSAVSVGKPGSLNLNTPTWNTIVPNAFKIFFIIGAIAVVLMLLWGAVEWIFSGGNKEKVGAARGRIINALIGFAILALAFLIATIIGRVVGFNPLQNFDVPFLGAPVSGTCPIGGTPGITPGC